MLSLNDAKAKALSRNLEISEMAQALEEARFKSMRARSPFLPQVGLSGGMERELKRGEKEDRKIGYIYGNYNLFNGFSDSNNLDAAKEEIRKAEIILEAKRFSVALDVERNFIDYLAIKAILNLKLEAKQTNDKLAEHAEERKKAGLGSEADIIEFQMRNSAIESELKLLRTELNASKLEIMKLIGANTPSDFEISGFVENRRLSNNVDQKLKDMAATSRDLKTLESEVRIANMEVSKASSGFLPKIDFEARSGYLESRDSNIDDKPTSTFLLVAKLELFSGLDTFAARKEALTKSSKLQTAKEKYTTSAAADALKMLEKIQTTERRIELEKQNESRSNQYYNAVLREYGAGLKNSADVKVAADLVTQNKEKIIRFIQEFYTQKIELEKILGVSLDTEIAQNLKASEGAL